jgi:hypothetical protein
MKKDKTRIIGYEEQCRVDYTYFTLSRKEKRNFIDSNITQVKLRRRAIKQLTEASIKDLAGFENCSIKAFKKLLDKNERGGRLTRIEVILKIAELENLHIWDIIKHKQGVYPIICLKKPSR